MTYPIDLFVIIDFLQTTRFDSIFDPVQQ